MNGLLHYFSSKLVASRARFTTDNIPTAQLGVASMSTPPYWKTYTTVMNPMCVSIFSLQTLVKRLSTIYFMMYIMLRKVFFVESANCADNRE